MRENDPLGEKSIELGVKSVLLSRELRQLGAEHSIINQFVRSSTSIGANISEAQQAESPVDMRHKFGVALKEAVETKYWLKIISKTNKELPDSTENISALLKEVTAILVSSRNTLQARINASKPTKG